MTALVLCASAVVSAQSPPPAEEPSLAEIAEKTKKTRTKPASKKVLTNDDLKNAKGNVIVLPAEAVPVATEPTVAPSPAEGDASGAPLVPPGEIQGRIDELSGRIARLRKAVDEAQREASGDPEPERRASLVRTIEESRKAMVDAELMILGLEEAARRLGVTVSRP
jgi:hypothetical protein